MNKNAFSGKNYFDDEKLRSHTGTINYERYEILTEVKMSRMVFWVVTLCVFEPSRSIQYVSPKRWYLLKVHTTLQTGRPPSTKMDCIC
jgi:hypothetical protein